MRARRRFSILQQSHSSCATSTKTDDFRLMSSLPWSTLVQISNGSRHWLARQWTILGLIMLDSCKSLWEQRGWQETTSCKGSCVLMPMQKPSILLKLLQSLQRLPRQQQPRKKLPESFKLMKLHGVRLTTPCSPALLPAKNKPSPANRQRAAWACNQGHSRPATPQLSAGTSCWSGHGGRANWDADARWPKQARWLKQPRAAPIAGGWGPGALHTPRGQGDVRVCVVGCAGMGGGKARRRRRLLGLALASYGI